MKLFDLHCDTASELYKKKQPLFDNTLHISVKKTAAYESYVQVAAIWSDYRLGDEEAWEEYLHISDNFRRQIQITPNTVQVSSGEEIRAAAASGKRAFLSAVEDARILHGHMYRLDEMHRRGVRILTLTWQGVSCIGGAHNTNEPLTEFGRDTVYRCLEMGIVPDVSHASRAVTEEVLRIAAQMHRPVIASHSDSYSVYPHSRNLTDEEFLAISASGGIVGISLAPVHLAGNACGLHEVAAHIAHYCSLGGENTVCLGCDYDGIETTPAGLENVSVLPRLAEYLRAHEISSRVIDKIFFENAYGFAVNNIK